MAGTEKRGPQRARIERRSPKAAGKKPTARPAAKRDAVRPARTQAALPKQPQSGSIRGDVAMLVILAAGILWTVASRVPAAVGAPVSSSPSPRQGFLAPAFTLDTLQGGTIALTDLRGRVAVVNFWASWCFPCRQETPALQAVYEQYKDSGVVILGVNMTNQDSMSDVQAFVQEFGLTYPILLDRDGSVGLQYRIEGLPTTFFVNRGGVIRTVVVGGPMSDTFIRSKIEALLAEGG